MTSTVCEVRIAGSCLEIGEWEFTDAADDEWDHEPCSRTEHSEDVRSCYEGEESDENASGDHRRLVVVVAKVSRSIVGVASVDSIHDGRGVISQRGKPAMWID